MIMSLFRYKPAAGYILSGVGIQISASMHLVHMELYLDEIPLFYAFVL
jgi:hypothetical protein